jgi:hypothetical protein
MSEITKRGGFNGHQLILCQRAVSGKLSARSKLVNYNRTAKKVGFENETSFLRCALADCREHSCSIALHKLYALKYASILQVV